VKPFVLLSVQLLVVFCLAGGLVGQESATQTAAKTGGEATATSQRPRFVPVLLSVTDEKGNPIVGLTKEQITLSDAKQVTDPLKIYRAQDIPLHLGIILLATDASFAQQQAAAIDLVQKVIRPNIDEAFVVTARGKKAWPSDRLDWKRDPAELAGIIKGLDRNAGLPDAFSFDMQTAATAGDENAGRLTIQTYSGNAITVFDAIYAMMNSDPRPARRVFVMFREPWSHSPGYGNRVNGEVEDQMRRVIDIAQAMHIATFVIGLEDAKFNGITDNTIGQNYISLHAGDDGGAGTATREYDREMEHLRQMAYDAGKANLQRLATETGGAIYWSAKKNYPDAVGAIANEIAGQYIVTFAPTDVPGPSHPLSVTASGGARVLTQAKYFLETPQ
jgi:VWFA-related protein